jgi:hypothetical protein
MTKTSASQPPDTSNGRDLISPDRGSSIDQVGTATNGRVHPQKQQISIPEMEDDEHGQKRAGDAFELDELFDLNGENFW